MLTLERNNNSLVLTQQLEFITEQQLIDYEQFSDSSELINIIAKLVNTHSIYDSWKTMLYVSIAHELAMPEVYKKLEFLIWHKIITRYSFTEEKDIELLLQKQSLYQDILAIAVTKLDNRFYFTDTTCWNSYQLDNIKTPDLQWNVDISIKTSKENNYFYYIVFLSIVTNNELYLVFDSLYNNLAITDWVWLKQAIWSQWTIAIKVKYPFLPEDEIVDGLKSKYSWNATERISSRCRELIIDKNVNRFSVEKKDKSYIISRTMRASPRDLTQEIELKKYDNWFWSNNKLIHKHSVQYKEITIKEKISKT